MKNQSVSTTIFLSTTRMVRVNWQWVKEAETVGEALASVVADDRTLSAWLLDLVNARGTDRMSVIRQSGLNQTFGYQIFAGERRPSRDKLIQLAFGLELDAREACELLERGGMSALRSSCRRDVVIAFCLEHGLGVNRCDDLLWDARERTIMAPDA